MQPMILAKQSVDLHTSSLTQAIAAAAVQAPWYSHHLTMLRTNYQAKASHLAAELHNAFPFVQVAAQTGGMFLWVDMGIDTDAWLERALSNGVCFVPGSAFAVTDGAFRTHARFGFATASLEGLSEAVARLSDALQ